MGPLINASITSQECEENINVTLKRLRHSHLYNVIFPCLNINSIRNKFGDLDKIIDGNIDILCISFLFPVYIFSQLSVRISV